MRIKEKKVYSQVPKWKQNAPLVRPRAEPKIEEKKLPQENSVRRIAMVGEHSSYYRYRHLIEGKLVRLLGQGIVGWRCEFVHDEDSKKLNTHCGWSNDKKEYLFDCVKFK